MGRYGYTPPSLSIETYAVQMNLAQQETTLHLAGMDRQLADEFPGFTLPRRINQTGREMETDSTTSRG